jgi:hypothetical protein
VHDLRVEGEVDLSIFDDLQPDQDFMINPSGAVADDIYTVDIDPVSGAIGVQSVDPTTIVTAPPAYDDVTSDGGTPSTPTVTLVSGPGWIKVKWDASTGTADPLHYKVFMRATSNPTTVDDTYLVADTHTLESVVNKLTGGTQLSDATTYKVIVKAYSRIAGGGTSADSSVASGSPAAIDASVTTVSNLNASNITTGTLSASFIATGTMTADITISGSIKTATSGARVELDEDGIRVYDGGSTDYGAPSGAGVTGEFADTGTIFIRGTINATGVFLDMDTNVSQQDEKSVVWFRSDATVAGYIYDYTDGGLTDSTMQMQALAEATGTAHLSVRADAGSEGADIRMHADDTANTAYVQVNVDGTDTIKLLDDTGLTTLNNLEFDQDTAEPNPPAATFVRLRNNDDGMGRSTLAVSKEGLAGIYRDLSRVAAAHGDSLRLNSFLFTDCTQIGTAPTTNTLVEDGFLVGYTGTGSTITDTAAAAHGGVWTLRMGTTASTSFCNVTGWRDFTLTNAYRIYLGVIFRIPNASNATDRYDFAFGFMVGTDPRAVTDGIFVRYSDSKATPAGTASTFDLVQCNGSNRSADAMDDNGGAITLSAGQWYMIEMEIIPGTGTSVWVTEPGGTKTKKVTDYNNNFPVSVSTNNQFRTLIKRAAGSSNTRDVDVDAIWGHIEYATDRIP